MNKELFREILEFRKYGNCLKELYKDYRNYLVEKVLNELTVDGLSNTFRYIFKKNVKDEPEATKDEINKFKKSATNKKYCTRFGKAVKDGSVSLEITPKEYCDKKTFIQEFKKEDFSEFEDKDDIALEDTINEFLNDVLSIYDDEGWLKLDNYENIEKKNELRVLKI